jgi:hypothetical protein
MARGALRLAMQEAACGAVRRGKGGTVGASGGTKKGRGTRPVGPTLTCGTHGQNKENHSENRSGT